MFLYASLEQVVPADHPLRPIRAMVDAALRRLDGTFDELYGDVGRPSIAPERLLRAQLLMLLYSIRSERMLMEQLRYNLLFRWFVGLGMNEEVWHATVFAKNRDRLLEGEVARAFFGEIVRMAKRRGLMSSEHFSVDGTMVEAWASQKSFQPKQRGSEEKDKPAGGGRNAAVDWRGQRRSNDTHESVTDPEARLWRKSQTAEAKLSYLGHVLTENRHGLIVNVRLTRAHGRAEREAAVEMAGEIAGGVKRVTLAADRGYDVRETVKRLRELNVTPHVAQNTRRRSSAVDGRTTRHEGYRESQRKRKMVEEFFGWAKVVAGLRKVKLRGREKVGWLFTLAAAAYNLIRMRNLMVATA
jgi:transposase